jgi:hypothetical protein
MTKLFNKLKESDINPPNIIKIKQILILDSQKIKLFDL